MCGHKGKNGSMSMARDVAHERCYVQAPSQPVDYGGTSPFGGPPVDSLSASSATAAMAPMSWDPAGTFMPAATEPAKQQPDALYLPPLPGMQQSVSTPSSLVTQGTCSCGNHRLGYAARTGLSATLPSPTADLGLPSIRENCKVQYSHPDVSRRMPAGATRPSVERARQRQRRHCADAQRRQQRQ